MLFQKQQQCITLSFPPTIYLEVLVRQRQFPRVSDDGRDAVSLLESLMDQLLPGLTSRAENSDLHDLSGQNTRMCEITAAIT